MRCVFTSDSGLVSGLYTYLLDEIKCILSRLATFGDISVNLTVYLLVIL